MPLITPKDVIGQVEQVSFPVLNINSVYARIDTGAKTSSVYASKAYIYNNALNVIFFGSENEHYTGSVHTFSDYGSTIVASSNGMLQQRYKVKLKVVLNQRIINATFTLADRSMQVYPVLVGRNILRGKFIVDVNKGNPLKIKEAMRTEQIAEQINQRILL